MYEEMEKLRKQVEKQPKDAPIGEGISENDLVKR